MAQSSLYKRGSSTSQDVNVTDRSTRDLGQVDVQQFPSEAEFDMVDDSTRLLGQTSVTNTVAAEIQNVIETTLANALVSDGSDTLRVAAPNPLDVSASTVTTQPAQPTGVEDSTGTTIDPATSGPQGNWVSGHDETFEPVDTTVTQLPGGSVPDGVAVEVQADKSNADTLAIGLTSSPAIDISPGEVFTARVSNRSQIRIQVTTAGDSVNICHEAN